MNKLITASIDVMKIDKSKLITGKKGTYLNLSIWVNEEPDAYGNNFAIQQKDCKTYLGNGKWFVPKEDKITPEDAKKTSVKSMSNPDDLPF